MLARDTMKVIDFILEDEKEAAAAPPTLSRQGNVRGALGPGAFPVSARGQHDHDDTTIDGDSSLPENDEEQPPSTDAYLAEATAVTDGNSSLVEVQRIAHITEVYEGKIVMPNEEVDDKKEKGHRPVWSRKTFLLVAIAVVITGAIVGVSTYALASSPAPAPTPTPWEQSREEMLGFDPPTGTHDGKNDSEQDGDNYADNKNGCNDSTEEDSSENTRPPGCGP